MIMLHHIPEEHGVEVRLQDFDFFYLAFSRTTSGKPPSSQYPRKETASFAFPASLNGFALVPLNAKYSLKLKDTRDIRQAILAKRKPFLLKASWLCYLLHRYACNNSYTPGEQRVPIPL